MVLILFIISFAHIFLALEGDFEKYMPHFNQFLLMCLRSYEDYEVCTIAVGVVGDICRALQKKVVIYCDEIISVLIRNLQVPNNVINVVLYLRTLGSHLK